MQRPLFGICLCLVLVALIKLWTAGYAADSEDDVLRESADGQEVVLIGQIYQKDEQTFYLKEVSLNSMAANPQQNISLSEKYICELEQTEQNAKVQLGSFVRVRGKFMCFDSATNPGEFDQRAYYASLKIGGKIKNTRILAESSEYSKVQELLYNLQQHWKKRLYQIFPEKEASILCTMILGDKSDLDAEIKDLYRRNGIIHILSISGLHITLIGMSVYRLLRRLGLPPWAAAVIGAEILVLYGLMTGMGVSAQRAIGMYLIRMLGEVLGRTYDMFTALGVMGAIMVWQNPGYLCHAGFLLSFGSILGIGVLYPTLKPTPFSNQCLRYEEWKWKAAAKKAVKKIWEGISSSFFASLSITLATLPIQLWFYFEVPVYSVLLNLLVLPLMTPVMLAGLTAMLVPGFGFLGWIDMGILTGYQILCELFSKLPNAVWNPGQPEVWQVVAYYLLLFGVVRWKTKGRKVWGIKCLVTVLAIFSLTARTPFQTQVLFLDVGQGDCIVVQLQNGSTYLFDGGSSSRKKVGTYIIAPALKSMGARRVSAAFVSHPDSDHCNGILELLENGEVQIEQLILPAIAKKARTDEFTELLQAAESAKVSVGYMGAGDSWQQGQMYFACMGPQKGMEAQEANSYSQVFLMRKGEFSMLLTGDVQDEGEEYLLQQLTEMQRQGELPRLTLLKVAHHGSRNSTPKELLSLLNPQYGIISCGENNSYGHPHAELLERMQAQNVLCLRTDECGAIKVGIFSAAINKIKVEMAR